jgi:LPS O-antigen subunit length determinant protein (WzzB/FepE family)
MPKKKPLNDEIDLIGTLLIVWNKKWQVLLITVFVLIGSFITQLYKSPDKVTANTEIRPISVFDEAKYKIYNSIINTIRPYYVKESRSKITSEDIAKIDKNYKIINTEVNDLEINNINKLFLLNLFVEKLNEKSYLVNAIKKFDLIKEENYPNKLKYEEAVINLASSISLLNIDDINSKSKKKPVMIEFKTYDITNWENFLKFVEKEVNLEIQIRLSKMFDNYISYVEAITRYEIEDIDTQLSVTLNEDERIKLKKKKSILKANKYVDRMQDIFFSSPISNSDEFYASKIIYDSTSYIKVNSNTTTKKRFILFIIIGVVIGIFFVLLSNAIQKRR